MAQGSGRQRGFRRDSVQLRLEHGQGLCVNRRASKPGQTSRAASRVPAFMLDRARRTERDDRMTALSASAWHAQQRTGVVGEPQQREQIDRSGAARLYRRTGVVSTLRRELAGSRVARQPPVGSEAGAHGHNRAQESRLAHSPGHPSARCRRYAGARDQPLLAASRAHRRGSSRDPHLLTVMLYLGQRRGENAL